MIGAFTKNTLITFATRFLTSILGVVATIIIARALGPGGKGIYSLAILSPTLLFMIVNFGLDSASTFYIGKKKYSPKEIFGTDIILSVLIIFLTTLAGLAIIFLFGDKLFPGAGKIYLLLGLSLFPFYAFFYFISSILFGLRKIKECNIVSFIQAFSSLILFGILLLGFHFGVKAAILTETISFILACAAVLFFVAKETKGIILKLNKKYLKDAITYGLKVYLGGIFYLLHHRIDIILINFFINPVAVGFYSVAVELAEGVWFFSTISSALLFQKVASETDEKNLKEFTPIVCRNIFSITLIISALLFIFGDRIILLLYSGKFLESVRPFRILLIGTLLASGWQVLCNDLAGRGKPMLTTYIVGVSVVVNIILNIFWIPKWGIEGAAFAAVSSYLVTFLITIFVYSRISGNKIRDIILFKKSDFKFYKNILSIIKNPTQLL